ncbi:hypothetical protein GCM10010420_22030 [Streptomyces glaucosporus]|uniref:L,D-TPase catalytic domain-containing protein n=1 Tax=Streptomyces glaucosporus TaxID=284044 RepID=A0ABN3I6H9_9ACTN
MTHRPTRAGVGVVCAAAAVALLASGCAVQPAGAEPHGPAASAPPSAAPSVTAAAPAAPAAPSKPPSASASTGRKEAAEHEEKAGKAGKPAPPAAPTTSAAPPPALMAQGSEGEKVRELQARLRQTGHFGLNPTGYYGTVTVRSVSAFQKGRGLPADGRVTDATWRTLTAHTRTPTRQELYPPTTRPVADPDPRCLTGRVLCISKESRTLAWMIDGKIVSAMDVRFGSELTPTREGEFGVTFKSRHHHSTLYDTPMPYALFFSGGQAVHYSADFAANGYNGASHGCVNVRDEKKIAALFDQVRVGEKVVVY